MNRSAKLFKKLNIKIRLISGYTLPTKNVNPSIVSTHPFCWGWGVEPPTKFLKREGLESISIFRGGCRERGGGGDSFQGVAVFR